MAELHGFINVLKPPQMTSHDVVAWLRRRLHTKAVGHAGTLDPAAAGVLPVAIGKATRLLEYVSGEQKQYVGEVTFGVSTDTLDQEGRVLDVKSADNLTLSQVQEKMRELQGVIWQKPPAFSAVKLGGKPLYEYARAGEQVDVAARRVEVTELNLLAFHPGQYPRALFRVSCSKGTYVRVLAHDLAASLGLPGCLTFLLRSAVGRFTADEGVTLEEIEQLSESNQEALFLLPLALGLGGMEQVRLDRPDAIRFLHGQRLKLAELPAADHLAVYWEEELLGIASNAGGMLAPRKVVAKGEELGLQ